MTDETLFAAALDRATPQERAVFLDQACGGDAALRRRVDALLASHEHSAFLNTPAVPPGVGQALGQGADVSRTQGEASTEDDTVSLAFLTSSQKPGSLGCLGHYEVQKIIGKGGMGIVLRAFDEKLHRVVAIKVMAPALAVTATARLRFIREAQAAAAVRNDHVIDIHAVEGDSEPPYLVMEYIEGQSLQELLDKTGPLELKEILRIGMQTAAGLAAAHAQGLIHRDIKPANILLENGVQRVKITDFGLARAVDDASLTQSGFVAGSPQYMSPEQARGEALDQRTDLFSLGSVLYAMCTGHPPFRASGNLAVLRRVEADVPRPIAEIRPEIPQWLVEIIDKLLAKNPAERFSSAAEVGSLLGQYLAHTQQPASIPQPPGLKSNAASASTNRPATPRRRWLPAALLMLVTGLALTEITGVTRMTATLIGSLAPAGNGEPEANGVNGESSVGWTQLFNGNDLSGWKSHSELPGDWRVEDGVLVGGPAIGYLFTDRGDYEDFHFRIEAKMNLDGNAGQLFRTEYRIARSGRAPVPPGYEAEITIKWVLKAGTLLVNVPGPNRPTTVEVREFLARADEWFSQEVIARGNHFIVKVNGKTVADYVDPAFSFRQGHLTLQTFDPGTLVRFRKIEVKELPAIRESKPAPGSAGDREQPNGASRNLVDAQKKAGGFDPRDANAWNKLARALRTAKNLPAALDACQKALAIDSENVTAWCALGDVLSDMNKLDEALIAYHRAAEIDPRNMSAFHGLGSAYARSRAWGKAAAAYERALELNPNYHWLAHCAAIIRLHQGDVEGYRRVCRQSLERFRNPDDPQFAERIAKICLLAPGAVSDLEPVRKLADRALAGTQTHPYRWYFWLVKGLAEHRSGRHKEAIKWLERCAPTVERMKLNAMVFALLAMAHHELGENELARRALADAQATIAKLMPDHDKNGALGEDWYEELIGQMLAREARERLAKAAGSGEPKEDRPIVLLGQDGQPNLYFGTLDQAAAAATSGDTIEIRGNGPFTPEPIEVLLPLTIRAGHGYQPVINTHGPDKKAILAAKAPLVLEGLEFQCAKHGTAVGSLQVPLHVANCRFTNCGLVSKGSTVQVRNCQSYASVPFAFFAQNAPARTVFDNNVAVSPQVFAVNVSITTQDHSLEMNRNLLVGIDAIGVVMPEPAQGQGYARLSVRASENLVAGRDLDVVGPGAAYERWKMTPGYQEWLKNTGQAKK